MLPRCHDNSQVIHAWLFSLFDSTLAQWTCIAFVLLYALSFYWQLNLPMCLFIVPESGIWAPYTYGTPVHIWGTYIAPYMYTRMGHPLRVWGKICIWFVTQSLITISLQGGHTEKSFGTPSPHAASPVNHNQQCMVWPVTDWDWMYYIILGSCNILRDFWV